MREEIVNKLSTARKALGNVYVNEEQNCFNLGGAMQLIREVIELLKQCEIIAPRDIDDDERR